RAASPSDVACRTVSTPPGIRTRASAPSSAACSLNAPGQASPPSRETAVAWDDEGWGAVDMAASIPTITPGARPAALAGGLLCSSADHPIRHRHDGDRGGTPVRTRRGPATVNPATEAG